MNWEFREKMLISELCEKDESGKVDDERSPLWGVSLLGFPTGWRRRLVFSIGNGESYLRGEVWRTRRCSFLLTLFFPLFFSDETRICI